MVLSDPRRRERERERERKKERERERERKKERERKSSLVLSEWKGKGKNCRHFSDNAICMEPALFFIFRREKEKGKRKNFSSMSAVVITHSNVIREERRRTVSLTFPQIERHERRR